MLVLVLGWTGLSYGVFTSFGRGWCLDWDGLGWTWLSFGALPSLYWDDMGLIPVWEGTCTGMYCSHPACRAVHALGGHWALSGAPPTLGTSFWGDTPPFPPQAQVSVLEHPSPMSPRLSPHHGERGHHSLEEQVRRRGGDTSHIGDTPVPSSLSPHPPRCSWRC